MTASEWNVLVTETAYQDLREAAAYMRDTLLPPKPRKRSSTHSRRLLSTYPHSPRADRS